MIVEKICKNCLNAYNDIENNKIICWNKEFEKQFIEINEYVEYNDSCDQFTIRRNDQVKINNCGIQLKLF